MVGKYRRIPDFWVPSWVLITMLTTLAHPVIIRAAVVWFCQVDDLTVELKVTLVWMDPPVLTFVGRQLLHDLDLMVFSSTGERANETHSLLYAFIR